MAAASTPWPIDRDHGMHKGPGYLGDAHHSLRIREVFKYYEPEDQIHYIPPLNTSDTSLDFSPSLIASHDPILACFANQVTRLLDAKRCIVTMTGAGLSYVIAESTRTLSMRFPHTHAPGDQLFLGGGSATASMDGLCEHTISLLPPPLDSDEPFLLEIPDLRKHPKYCRAGYVNEWPRGRFYAGAPLRTRNGVSVGTVCVLDDRPRYAGLTGLERIHLSNMADIFMAYFEVKQGDRDLRKCKLMETELSRFIAEGLLPGDGVTMTERRDGRLWSEKILEQRKAKEMQRRKRTEEKRQMFQERQFADMMRKEKSMLCQQPDPIPAVVTTTSILPDGTRFSTVPDISVETIMPGVKLPAQQHSEPPQTHETGAALEPIIIAHTRPLQPGIVETSISLENATKHNSIVETIMHGSPNTLDVSPGAPSTPPVSDGLFMEESNVLAKARELELQVQDFTSTGPSTTFSTSSLHHMNSFTGSDYSDITSTPDTSTSALPDNASQGFTSRYEESYIESDFRAMFSRAATLIRGAINANVLFVDGDLEGFFGRTGKDTDTCPSNEDHSSYVSTDLDAEAATRAKRPKSVRNKTGILAYSTSGGQSNAQSTPGSRIGSPKDLGFDVSELSEEALRHLAEENMNGQIVVEDVEYPGLPDVEGRASRRPTDAILQKFLPGSKSVIVVPLSDHDDKLFAVCFVWTCCSTRSFCEDVEGRFVVALVNCIMGEMTRLSILNADKAKSEFISSISHELRSPLHGILASANFLAESCLDSDQQSFVDTVISCASTLLDTVNHVLDFQELTSLQDNMLPKLDVVAAECSMESSGLGYNETSSLLASNRLIDTDLSALMQNVLGGLCLGYWFQGFPNISDRAALAVQNGGFPVTVKSGKIDVIMDIDRWASGWVFAARSAAFSRIINNLLGNAFKYNKDSGWIRVCLVAEDDGPGTSVDRVTRVKLSVSDSGKGISREFLKTKLFTPFCQENPLSAGSGLGLSIVRLLVDTMQGKIDVQSEVGIGTTVTIEVPLAQRQSDDHACVDSEALALEKRTRGKKVRLVGFGTTSCCQKKCPSSLHGTHLLRASVVQYLGDYFGIEVLDDNDIALGDIIVANEITDENRSAIHRLSSTKPVQVIMMCYQPPTCDKMDFLGGYSTTFMRKPCGPRKLAKAIKVCLDFLEERTAMDPQQLTVAQGQLKATVIGLPIYPPAHPTNKNSKYNDGGLSVISPAEIPSISTTNPMTYQQSIDPINSTLLPPAPTLPPRPPGPPLPPAAALPDKPTVLVVEDNFINMKLLTTYLKKAKYTFDQAADGLEAFNKAKLRSYDIILMDLQMPIMSGIESTREIRTFEAAATGAGRTRAFIVALTGLAAASDRRDAFGAGVDAFMVKPVNFRKLEEVVVNRGVRMGAGLRAPGLSVL